MKCTNCGFKNESNKSHCIKCNSPLIMDQPAEFGEGRSVQDIAGTIVDLQAQESYVDASSSNPKTFESKGLARTLMGEQPRERYIDRPAGTDYSNHIKDQEIYIMECNHCNYRLMPGATFCPNCNKEVNVVQGNLGASSKKPSAFAGTIDPYSRKGFTLRPVINGEPAKEGLEFNGGSAILNRENTIKDNMTITSKEQAEIVIENGEWYIVDKSEKKTTFVRAGNKIKLNKGDIVLLGDTKFIFE
jgi:uncharacterized OB-fold protein